MLIYCNDIIMKQGSYSFFCAGAVMIHHDSAVFQKVGTMGLRRGSLSCFSVVCLNPGVPLEFYLLPQTDKPLLPVPPSVPPNNLVLEGKRKGGVLVPLAE